MKSPHDARRFAMNVSLGMSLFMLVGKVTAYLLTNSSAILADASESVVHGAATGVAAFSLWFAARPADSSHPYGHGRIAYFSVGVEGTLVFFASIAVIWSGVAGLIVGPQLRDLGIGIAISIVLALANLVLGTSLIAVGKKHDSMILIANGRHVLSDMWTTAAAVIGVGAVMLTGIDLLDPIVAILIGGYIMFTGATMLRKAIGGLMDEIDPELSNTLLGGLQTAVNDGIITDFHHLRCRTLDDQVWVEVHLLVPGDLPVLEAHSRATGVESALRKLFPKRKVQITSHIEPEDHEKAHPGGHLAPDPFSSVGH